MRSAKELVAGLRSIAGQHEGTYSDGNAPFLCEAADYIERTAAPPDGLPEFETTAEPPKCTCGAVDAYDHSQECVDEFRRWKEQYREGLKEQLARAIARAASETRRADEATFALGRMTSGEELQSLMRLNNELVAERHREAAARRDAVAERVKWEAEARMGDAAAGIYRDRAEQAEAALAGARDAHDRVVKTMGVEADLRHAVEAREATLRAALEPFSGVHLGLDDIIEALDAATSKQSGGGDG